MFQVRDYTTIMVGFCENNVFYVERGDGTKYEYDSYRIVWFHKIFSVDKNRGVVSQFWLQIGIDDSAIKLELILQRDELEKKIKVFNKEFKNSNKKVDLKKQFYCASDRLEGIKCNKQCFDCIGFNH
jgi:hypothetical protein